MLFLLVTRSAGVCCCGRRGRVCILSFPALSLLSPAPPLSSTHQSLLLVLLLLVSIETSFMKGRERERESRVSGRCGRGRGERAAEARLRGQRTRVKELTETWLRWLRHRHRCWLMLRYFPRCSPRRCRRCEAQASLAPV